MTAMEKRISLSPFPSDNPHRSLLDPGRITSAREAAGLTKVRLADAMGVTERTISNYEKTGAPAESRTHLAQALNVMPSYFDITPETLHVTDLDESQVWFRSMRKSTALQRKSAVGHGRYALLLFAWIEAHFFLPPLNFDITNGENLSPQDAASLLRSDWGYGENPLPSLTKLAESHGIRIFSLPPVDEAVDAFSFVFQDTPYIAVDTVKSAERIRFDIAHELGHLVMHESGLSERPFDADASAPHHKARPRDIEQEAHAFASALLMPAHRVLSLIPPEGGTKEILNAKRYFKVSAMAMAHRAHDLGRLSDWSYRKVCSQLTSLGYRTAEPRGIEPEQSTIFNFIAESNRKKGISIRTLSEETGLVPQEIHDLSFGRIMAVTSHNPHPDENVTIPQPTLTLHKGGLL